MVLTRVVRSSSTTFSSISGGVGAICSGKNKTIGILIIAVSALKDLDYVISLCLLEPFVSFINLLSNADFCYTFCLLNWHRTVLPTPNYGLSLVDWMFWSTLANSVSPHLNWSCDCLLAFFAFQFQCDLSFHLSWGARGDIMCCFNVLF